MGTGLTTLSRKNGYVMEKATEGINTTVCDGLTGLSTDARMTATVKSRKDVNGKKLEVLSAKHKTS